MSILLNKVSGILVNDVQPENVSVNVSISKALPLNNPAGISVNDVHPANVRSSAPLFQMLIFLNRFSGIDVIPVL